MTEIATEATTVVAPEKVARVTPPIGTDHGLAGNRYHVTTGAAGKLTEHDLTVTTSARLGVWLGYTLVAGPPADHGEVADSNAMLALHDWDTDPHDVVLYHYVLPGDSCTRADDPGYRWVCLRNHGQALTDWERRPLAAPISDLRSDVDELIAEMPTKIGSAALDGYIHTDNLDTSESLASNSTTIAPSTSAVRAYVASGWGTGMVVPAPIRHYPLTSDFSDLMGGAALTPTNAIISSGWAVLTAGYLVIPDGPDLALSEWSVAVEVIQTGTEVWQRPFDLGESTADYVACTLYSGSGDNFARWLGSKVGDGTEQRVVSNEGTYRSETLGPWPLNHRIVVVVTRDANGGRMYLNGVLHITVPGLAALSAFPSRGNSAFGRSQYSGDSPFSGKMRNGRIWGGCLSPLQVAAISG